MPTYVYQLREGQPGCEACREGFEEMQRMSDAPLAACPKCGSAVERVIAAAHITKSNKDMLSDKNLAAHGFKRMVREEKDRYRETTK
jgi:putative FmdB family regulatory protein